MLGFHVDDDFTAAAIGQDDGKADVVDDTAFVGDFVFKFIIDDFLVGKPWLYEYLAYLYGVFVDALFNYW